MCTLAHLLQGGPAQLTPVFFLTIHHGRAGRTSRVRGRDGHAPAIPRRVEMDKGPSFPIEKP